MQNKARFLEIVELLSRAQCPEHVFGEVFLQNKIDRLGEEIEGFSQDVAVQDNETPKIQLGRMKEMFDLFAKWAKRLSVSDSYGRKLDYRLRFEAEVVMIEGEPMFRVPLEQGFVCLERIPAHAFQGLLRYDKVTVSSAMGQVLKEGCVMFSGTFIQGEKFEHVLMEEAKVLKPIDFEVGTKIEIKTWKTHDMFAILKDICN